jgi:hypothetical protein
MMYSLRPSPTGETLFALRIVFLIKLVTYQIPGWNISSYILTVFFDVPD